MLTNPDDPSVVPGDPLRDDVFAVLVDDERVGTRSGYIIGEEMPSGVPPVYYQPYSGGDIPTGALVMTEAIAIASGYTSIDLKPANDNTSGTV